MVADYCIQEMYFHMNEGQWLGIEFDFIDSVYILVITWFVIYSLTSSLEPSIN